MSTAESMKAAIKMMRDTLSELGKLNEDQLRSLMDGKAKFKYYDPDELKPAKKTAASAPKKGKIPFDGAQIEEIAGYLNACRNTEEGESYLAGKKLGVAELQVLAQRLNILLQSKKKADITAAIIRGTIGAKLEAESIQRV
jgi:hypothetical protein